MQTVDGEDFITSDNFNFEVLSSVDGYANVVLTVAVSDGTVTIGDVYNGTTKLTKTTHYTETGGKVTLLKAYLETLTEDDYTITIETSQGNVNAVITVVDTTDEV